MTEKKKYFDILTAKAAYAEGRNVTELLRAQRGVVVNTPEIIEMAYDLQAGTYIEHVARNLEQAHAYTSELATVLDRHVGTAHSLLDIGTGELTTLSLLTQKLQRKPATIFAFDISWSRIHRGLDFAQRNMGADFARLRPFVADIGELPLADKSINVTTSSHALEPNGGNLRELMAELFRVTVDKLVLFEPCYEINSDAGKERMDRLGYIKDVDGVVASLGGAVVEKIVINNVSNPLNPTVGFVITPPPSPLPSHRDADGRFSVPGTGHLLQRLDDFYYSSETGLCFPILKSIPVLRSSGAILASALAD